MLGHRIENLRSDLEMTQEKLAWEAGINSKGYLSRIERGERLPSLDVLNRLSQRLGVEMRDLFIFPSRGPVDRAMEVVRQGGVSLGLRVLKEFESAARIRSNQ